MFKACLSFLVGLLAIQTVQASPLTKRASAFFPPTQGGGSELDIVSPGLGEPLNVNDTYLRVIACSDISLQVIISGLSSSDVLTDDGFLNFAQAIGLYVLILQSQFSRIQDFTARLNASTFTWELHKRRTWVTGMVQ